MTDSPVAITTDADGQTLTMSRRFTAPRARVFAAWIEREQVARWFGPENVTCEIHRWDARPGGTYSLTMHHADGDETPLSGEFREVAPPERLVCTWIWGGMGNMAGRETLVTLEFEDAGEETVLHLRHSLLPDEDWAQKHSMGWGSVFNSLDAALAS